MPARAIAVLYTNRMQIVTTTATGITRMNDLKGKRISTGAPGSATELLALRADRGRRARPEKDFRARERLSPAESSNAIKDGKLDAYLLRLRRADQRDHRPRRQPGHDDPADRPRQLHAKIVEKHGPVYFTEVIPAGTYPGQTTDNKQMSVANVLAVREDMPADLVTQHPRRDLGAAARTWAQVHSEARGFKLEGQKTAPPASPGTRRRRPSGAGRAPRSSLTCAGGSRGGSRPTVRRARPDRT